MNKRSMIFLAAILMVFLTVALYFIPKITPVQLTMDAVKVDGDGNELGTTQLILSGSKLDYLFKPSRLDVYIHPFDNIVSIQPSNYVTKFGEVPGMIQNYPGREYLYTDCAAVMENSDYLIFASIGFSPDLTKWVICNKEASIYYVASVGNECTTAELLEYFCGLVH